MAKTIEQLKTQSAEVKNASVIGENTATRVGQLFGDIVEHVEEFENTKDNKDASQDATMQSLVSAEESRAKGEERGLQNQIHAEKIDRQTADTYLGNLIQQESSARETADENIRTALANETARAQAAEQELAAAQIYTSKIKDGAVTTPKIADGSVTYEKTDIIAQELGTNMTKVPSQKVVSDAISKEETERKADIDGLTAALGSETINREQADEAESNRAKGEERGLQNEIHAEKIDRKTADTYLSNLIQQETERAMAAEEANATAIDAAVTKNEEQDLKLSELGWKMFNHKDVITNSIEITNDAWKVLANNINLYEGSKYKVEVKLPQARMSDSFFFVKDASGNITNSIKIPAGQVGNSVVITAPRNTDNAIVQAKLENNTDTISVTAIVRNIEYINEDDLSEEYKQEQSRRFQEVSDAVVNSEKASFNHEWGLSFDKRTNPGAWTIIAEGIPMLDGKSYNVHIKVKEDVQSEIKFYVQSGTWKTSVMTIPAGTHEYEAKIDVAENSEEGKILVMSAQNIEVSTYIVLAESVGGLITVKQIDGKNWIVINN